MTTRLKSVDEVLESVLGVVGGAFDEPDRRGKFNQPYRRVHSRGLEVHFGSGREEQPIVLECAGAACDLLTADDHVMLAENLKASATRMDLAADLGEPEEAHRYLMQARRKFQAGECKTKLRKASTDYHDARDRGQGETVYFGSRQSELYCRMYTKRGPLRVEFEVKPEASCVREWLPFALKKYGAAGLWRWCGKRIEFPLPWYQDLLLGEVAEVSRAIEAETRLEGTMAALRRQFGQSFFALLLAGVKLEDLADGSKKWRVQQQRRFATWPADARALGYDPSALEKRLLEEREALSCQSGK